MNEDVSLVEVVLITVALTAIAYLIYKVVSFIKKDKDNDNE